MHYISHKRITKTHKETKVPHIGSLIAGYITQKSRPFKEIRFVVQESEISMVTSEGQVSQKFKLPGGANVGGASVTEEHVSRKGKFQVVMCPDTVFRAFYNVLEHRVYRADSDKT